MMYRLLAQGFAEPQRSLSWQPNFREDGREGVVGVSSGALVSGRIAIPHEFITNEMSEKLDTKGKDVRDEGPSGGV